MAVYRYLLWCEFLFLRETTPKRFMVFYSNHGIRHRSEILFLLLFAWALGGVFLEGVERKDFMQQYGRNRWSDTRQSASTARKMFTHPHLVIPRLVEASLPSRLGPFSCTL